MIPKVVHYCWFGRAPKPNLVQRCINSWKLHLPEYEIKEWNEDNYDYEGNQYVKEAYNEKKYAFVSDVVRLDILYRYGGLYFDTDVELLRPLSNEMMSNSFMACERQGKLISIAPGLAMGFYPHNEFVKKVLDSYLDESFYSHKDEVNLYTINYRISSAMEKIGWIPDNKIQIINNIVIYPSDYFCPFDGLTQKMHKTNNTYAVHWYMGSWADNGLVKRMKKRIKKYIPEKLYLCLFKRRHS